MSRRVLSLSSRIFLYMILLVILASVMIAALTIYQYKEQSQDYHRMRLERKETQLISSINYVLKESEVAIRQENLEYIFEHKINQISKIHNVKLRIITDLTRGKIYFINYFFRFLGKESPIFLNFQLHSQKLLIF